MKSVVKLINLPKEGAKTIDFVSHSERSSNKLAYPKFLITKYTQFDCELKEGGLYLIDFSASYDKDIETGEDLNQGRLFLKSVTDKGFSINGDETLLGLSVTQGIVGAIKQYTIENNNPKMPWLKGKLTFYRIKLKFAKTHTYLWYFNDICGFNKGDTISARVRLFNKRAYDEQGEIDYSPRHIYQGKNEEPLSRWYTELLLEDYTIID